MNSSRLFFLAVPIALVGLVSCGTLTPPNQVERPRPAMYDWYDRGGEGEVSVEISLDRQVARFRRGDALIGWCYVASGKGEYRTSAGDFKVLEKKVDKVSNLYGRIVNAEGKTVDWDAKSSDEVPEGHRFVPAPMPYWMRITWDGVGMHGGPIPNPGRPASHGCIRMPRKFVRTLFEAVEVGTAVTVRQSFSDNDWMVPGSGLVYAPSE